MEVTIVITAHNAESTIGAAIDSVRSQSYSDWELIIVDAGSTDCTFQVACEWSERDDRILALRLSDSSNYVAACNLAISERSRSSRHVLVLGVNDLLTHDALEQLVDALERDKAAVAVYGRFRLVDTSGKPLRTTVTDRFTDHRVAVDEDGRSGVLPISAPLSFEALVVRNYVKATGQMLIRSDALRRLGAFDPTAFPRDDWDMWIRLSLLGCIRMLDRIVLEHRVKSDSPGLSDSDIDKGEMYLRRKLAHTLAGEDLNRIALAGWMARERSLIAAGLRSALTLVLAGNIKQALIALLRACRSSAAYLYHWGIWRDPDDLPRHAGRQAVHGRAVAQS